MSSKYKHMQLTDAQGRMIHRMPNSERAKIFMPFDALKGLREALRETEAQALLAEELMRCEYPFDPVQEEREAPDLP